MKIRTFLIVAAACFCGVALAEENKQGKVTHVDSEAAEKLVQSGKVAVLDIRTAGEYSEGHIAGAKNIDFLENGFEQKIAGLDRSQGFLVHCAAGGRSTDSLSIFKKLGFQSIYHLDGGLNAWQGAGKPVVK